MTSRLQLDELALRFPTDSVSFGTIRRVDAYLLTRQSIDILQPGSVGIIMAHSLELKLAHNAYAAARGAEANDDRLLNSDDRQAFINMLNRYYCELGLSNGAVQTDELVRAMEQQASQHDRGGRGLRLSRHTGGAGKGR